MRMVGWLGSLAVIALTQFSGCGPAPQPVWNRDSRSFFFCQADGSVVQYDLDKAAARTLLGPGERRPHQVAVSPKLPFVAFAGAALGPEGRAAQVGMVEVDVKSRRITLRSLPEPQWKELEKIAAADKPVKMEEISCRYFRWLLGQRNGVYFADGRANRPSLGRRTLETRDRDEALQTLEELDLTMAIQYGLADASLLKAESHQIVTWAEGRKLYESFVKRPQISGGPRAPTAKRYRPVLDKFISFAHEQGRRTWNELNRQLMDEYAAWLDGESYEYATQYLELTTLKQVLKFLIADEHLPPTAAFSYPLKKPDGTDTYCWRPVEVAAILDHCDTPELSWLRGVIIGLAATGLRISELASLRWSDVDLEKGFITLTDETNKKKTNGREKRTTKSGRDRSFPIHQIFGDLLRGMSRHPDGRVFHGPLEGKIKADTVRRILIRDVLTPLAPSFPAPPDQRGFIDGRLHSFRHYFCSNCANSGVKERVLMDWLGHRSSRMVHRYYHLHDEESLRQMQQVKLY